MIRDISVLTDLVEWDVRNWSAALDFWLAYTSQKALGNCRRRHEVSLNCLRDSMALRDHGQVPATRR